MRKSAAAPVVRHGLGMHVAGGVAWLRLERPEAGTRITPDLIKESAATLAEVRASEEGREGILSFLKKREPAWLSQIKKTAEKKTAKPKAKRKK